MKQLLDEVKAMLTGSRAAAPFLSDWPLEEAQRAVTPSRLPVCSILNVLRPSDQTAKIWTALQGQPGLSWRQTYQAAEMSEAFLQGYGWSEFIGFRGPVPSTTIACGVLLLGPGVTYPAHAHAAEEVYIPIAGAAEWMRAEEEFCPKEIGSVIHHPSWMPHGMRTGAEGLAALYLWRGGDLAAKSIFLDS